MGDAAETKGSVSNRADDRVTLALHAPNDGTASEERAPADYRRLRIASKWRCRSASSCCIVWASVAAVSRRRSIRYSSR